MVDISVGTIPIAAGMISFFLDAKVRSQLAVGIVRWQLAKGSCKGIYNPVSIYNAVKSAKKREGKIDKKAKKS